MKISGWVCAFAAALTIGADARADDTQWTYIGAPELFTSSEDFPYAQLCAPRGWTPANSGTPAIAIQWEPLIFDFFGEFKNAIAQFRCDIAVVPSGALDTDPDLLALAQSMGLADMTAALVEAGGGADASAVARAPSEDARKIAEIVAGSCASHALRSVFTDCDCLGGLALDGLVNGRFPAPSGAHQVEASHITSTLEKNGIPEACVNRAGIADFMSGHADHRISSPLSATDSVISDPEGYRSCVVSEGLARFLSNPTLAGYNRSSGFVAQALKDCNARWPAS